MWKHIFGYGNTRFCLRKDTGAMNRPLRLTGCSQPISLVFVGISRIVRNVLAIRQQHFGNPFAMFWQTVRSRRVSFIVPAYMKTPTK